MTKGELRETGAPLFVHLRQNCPSECDKILLFSTYENERKSLTIFCVCDIIEKIIFQSPIHQFSNMKKQE